MVTSIHSIETWKQMEVSEDSKDSEIKYDRL